MAVSGARARGVRGLPHATETRHIADTGKRKVEAPPTRHTYMQHPQMRDLNYYTPHNRHTTARKHT